MNRFAENIVQLRQRFNLKQGEVADRIGIHRKNWSNWENKLSQPSVDGLLKICLFFGVSLADLVSGKSEDATLDGHEPEMINKIVNGGAQNRLAENIAWLRKKEGLKQAEAAEKVGVKRNTWSNWENEVSEPSIDDMIQISLFFQVSLDTLVLGELEESKNLDGPSAQSNDRGEDIIMVPLSFRASYLARCVDPEFQSTLPVYRLPHLGHGPFRMFEVADDTMAPAFDVSDLVVGRLLENLSEIQDGQVYVVVTAIDGVMVRRVVSEIHTQGTVSLICDNPNRQVASTTRVLSSQLREVWLVVAYISSRIPQPGGFHSRLEEIESRLKFLENKQQKDRRD